MLYSNVIGFTCDLSPSQNPSRDRSLGLNCVGKIRRKPIFSEYAAVKRCRSVSAAI